MPLVAEGLSLRLRLDDFGLRQICTDDLLATLEPAGRQMSQQASGRQMGTYVTMSRDPSNFAISSMLT